VVEYIEAELSDIGTANALASEVLGRSLDELPPQTRRLLGFIRQLVEKQRAEPGAKARAGAGLACFTRKELREHCGWSLTQVRVHLERLVELEYLAIRHGRLGSQFVYEILFDLEAPETLTHVGLIDLETLRTATSWRTATETHHYNTNLAGFAVGVAGGGQTAPPPATGLAKGT
jgi:hypothetical protein